MDVVLVGLPGQRQERRRPAAGAAATARRSSTSTSGSRRRRGRTIPEIFAAGRRGGVPAPASARRSPTSAPADPATDAAAGRSRPAAARSSIRATAGRSTAAGTAVWLDGRPEVLAQRLRRSPNVRPLVAGRDPIGRDPRPGGGARAVLRGGRRGSTGVAEVAAVVDAVEALVARGRAGRARRCCGATTPIGRHRRSATGSPPTALGDALRRLARAPRDPRLASPAPGRPSARALADGARAEAGWPSSASCCPRARRPSAWRSIEAAARELARLRVERGEPLVAVGGGALGDAAGFLAATYLRGVPLHPGPDDARRPDRLVDRRQDRRRPARGQEPRRRVPPAGGDRHRRRAAADAPRAPAAGRARRGGQDGRARRRARCSRCSSATGAAIARGDAAAFDVGCRGRARRARRLGEGRGRRRRRARARRGRRADHAQPRALARATRSRRRRATAALLHGEAVAYGLRAAARIGVGGRRDAAGAGRADRGAARRASGSRPTPLPYPLDAVLEATGDRQEARGRAAALGPADRRRRRRPRRRRPDELVERAAAGRPRPAAERRGPR